MNPTPAALIKASRLIFRQTHRTVPVHRIRLSLSTEPDQYEVRFTYPWPAKDGAAHSLIPRLTLAPYEFQAAEAWLDDRYKHTGGRPW